MTSTDYPAQGAYLDAQVQVDPAPPQIGASCQDCAWTGTTWTDARSHAVDTRHKTAWSETYRSTFSQRPQADEAP